MNEVKLASDVSKAARAAALLNDDTVKAALAQMRADYIEAWTLTSARDTDARERLWQAVQVVGKFGDHLNSVVANGKLAQAEIDAMTARDKAA